MIARYRKVDEDFFEALEEMLITADVGFNTVMTLTEELRMEAQRRNIQDTEDLREVIVEKIVEIYHQEDDNSEAMNLEDGRLNVILMVGVNGVVMYDAINAAKNKGVDILICDTAGRLQNKTNLMQELEKVKRVINRAVPDAPHEALLCLDATTGQNALSQARNFKEVTNVTGIVLTKLDGTAKGGIVLAIRNELHIPVKYVGLGEQLDDLQPFNPESYVYGLFADMIEQNEEITTVENDQIVTEEKDDNHGAK